MYQGKLISIEGIPGSPIDAIYDIAQKDSRLKSAFFCNIPFARDIWLKMFEERNEHDLAYLSNRTRDVRNWAKNNHVKERLQEGEIVINHNYTLELITLLSRRGVEIRTIGERLKGYGIWRPQVHIYIQTDARQAEEELLSYGINLPNGQDLLKKYKQKMEKELGKTLHWQRNHIIPFRDSVNETSESVIRHIEQSLRT